MNFYRKCFLYTCLPFLRNLHARTTYVVIGYEAKGNTIIIKHETHDQFLANFDCTFIKQYQGGLLVKLTP